MAHGAYGMGCSYGKCDHFTIEREGREQHCYITTEFYRCSSFYPVRSYIASEPGERILLTLPEISDRSQSWALGRSCLTNLAIVAVVAAGIGTMVLALSDSTEWWIYVLIWFAVQVFIFCACYAGCYKHKATQEDRAKYLQLMREDTILRDVLEHIRRNAPAERGLPPPESVGPINHSSYSEVSRLIYESGNVPVNGYGGLGSTVRTQHDTTHQVRDGADGGSRMSEGMEHQPII